MIHLSLQNILLTHAICGLSQYRLSVILWNPFVAHAPIKRDNHLSRGKSGWKWIKEVSRITPQLQEKAKLRSHAVLWVSNCNARWTWEAMISCEHNINTRIIRNYSRDSNSLELAVIEIVHEETRLPLICLSIENHGRKESGKQLFISAQTVHRKSRLRE